MLSRGGGRVRAVGLRDGMEGGLGEVAQGGSAVVNASHQQQLPGHRS